MNLHRNKGYVEWLQQEVYRFRGQISMALLYGSYLNQTATAVSDVDCYFIPKTPVGKQLAQTAIIEGIGYDLFPMSWERIKGIAEFRSPLTPLLGQVKVLYADSLEDLERFQQLQQDLQCRLQDQCTMHQVALESLSEAASMLARLMQADSIGLQRRWAGNFLLTLANAIAYENQTYYTRGLKKQREDLEKMDRLPGRFLQRYDAIMHSQKSEEIQKDCLLLLWETAEFLGFDGEPILPHVNFSPKPQPKPFNGDYLASWYEEGVSAFQKIYFAAESGNNYLAFIAAVCLEETLAEDLCQEFGWPEFDLMSTYNPEDLFALAQRANEIQSHLLQLLEESKTPLRGYESIAAFLEHKRLHLPEDVHFLDTSNLHDGEIQCRLESAAPLNQERNYVPTYYFNIVRVSDGQIMGRCDLRIGYNANIEIGGNVGYTIFEPYRGHHYAAKACRLLFKLAKAHGMKRMLITCRPDNEPSKKTCLAIGATLRQEIILPPDHELARASRTMLQYEIEI